MTAYVDSGLQGPWYDFKPMHALAKGDTLELVSWAQPECYNAPYSTLSGFNKIKLRSSVMSRDAVLKSVNKTGNNEIVFYPNIVVGTIERILLDGPGNQLYNYGHLGVIMNDLLGLKGSTVLESRGYYSIIANKLGGKMTGPKDVVIFGGKYSNFYNDGLLEAFDGTALKQFGSQNYAHSTGTIRGLIGVEMTADDSDGGLHLESSGDIIAVLNGVIATGRCHVDVRNVSASRIGVSVTGDNAHAGVYAGGLITADQGVVVSGWKATFRNDGTIQGGNFGGSIKGEGFEFANFGLITANTAVQATGDGGTIFNKGTIKGGQNGPALMLSGIGIKVYDYGFIINEGGDGIHAGGDNTIIVLTNLNVAGRAVYALANNVQVTVEKGGVVSGGTISELPTFDIEGYGTQIVNHGSIKGKYITVRMIGDEFRVTNDGWIIGDIALYLEGDNGKVLKTDWAATLYGYETAFHLKGDNNKVDLSGDNISEKGDTAIVDGSKNVLNIRNLVSDAAKALTVFGEENKVTITGYAHSIHDWVANLSGKNLTLTLKDTSASSYMGAKGVVQSSGIGNTIINYGDMGTPEYTKEGVINIKSYAWGNNIINHGTINGVLDQYAIYQADRGEKSVSEKGVTFENYGIVKGLIKLGSEIDVVTNHGEIISTRSVEADTLYDVDLGNGNDFYTETEGAAITLGLKIYGGNGRDIISSFNSSDNYFHGGDGVDSLYGRAGNDTLNGGDGHDELWGGEGKDIFIMDGDVLGSALVYDNVDFVQGEDKIQLSSDIFKDIKVDRWGKIAENQIANSYSATKPEHRLMYDSDKGYLMYDPDGNGRLAAGEVAFFLNKDSISKLTASDFILI